MASLWMSAGTTLAPSLTNLSAYRAWVRTDGS
jgi:hypothetical protein